MEAYLWITTIVAFILLGRCTIQKCKVDFSSKILRIIFILHLVFWFLLLMALILSCWNLYFRGYKSTTIIFNFIGWTGLFLYLFHKKETVPKFVHVSTYLFALSIGVITIFTTYDLLISNRRDIYYNDSKYRLELTFKGILAIAPPPDLFIKFGILEKRYDLNSKYIPKEKVKNILIQRPTKQIVRIVFFYLDTQHTASTDTVEIKIK